MTDVFSKLMQIKITRISISETKSIKAQLLCNISNIRVGE